ncbi:MAG TPA: condensation domain-containing protein, partial [Longimicrobium sp.]|nr:condensation domain-containing protein [Longimicrobium sp.]
MNPADRPTRYPLAPLQQGMLFHTLFAPRSGVDVEQLLCELAEEVDAVALRRAWRRAAERHALLRTSFRWEGLDEAVQEVSDAVEIPFLVEDWSGLPRSDADAKLREYLRAERRRGFEMDRAPLMRLLLVRHAADRYSLAWTFHHALLDGRAMVLVLREVFALYEAFAAGRELELAPPLPYAAHVRWLRERDEDASGGFWREVLRGFDTPAVLPQVRAARHAEAEYRETRLALPRAGTAALATLAEAAGFTLNTVVQGAWALLLARYTGLDDVAFGAVRSGRRSSVPGAGEIVGPFFNTVPVRVRVPAGARLVPWLRELRAQHLAVRDHEHTPLARVQEWSQIPRDVPLFQTLFSFERATMTDTLRAEGAAWRSRTLYPIRQPNFPINLSAWDGDE